MKIENNSVTFKEDNVINAPVKCKGAATCDFQQCDILTCVDLDEPV